MRIDKLEKSTFRFACYRRLKNHLGALDACTECLELSIRELLDSLDQSEDPTEYIKKLSDKHGIKVDNVDTVLLRRRIFELHIISAYSAMEGFLLEFKLEHPKSLGKSRSNGESFLQAIINDIDLINAVEHIGKLEVKIFDYYRLLRNSLLHSNPDIHKYDKNAVRCKEDVNACPKYKKLDAPNSCEKLSFDDFILLTRISKHLAEQLCKYARPSDNDIAKMLLNNHPTVKIRVRQYQRQKLDRHRDAISQALSREFSLTAQEASPIVSILIDGSLA